MKLRAYIEATYDVDLSDPNILEAYGVQDAGQVLGAEQEFLEASPEYLGEMLANEETDVRLITLSVVDSVDSSDKDPLPTDAEVLGQIA